MSHAAKPIASMTGYARLTGGDEDLAWTWEVKSVNGRTLDVRCRLPAGFEALDPIARRLAREHCARGNLQINLAVQRGQGPRPVRLNREVLDQVLALVGALKQEVEAQPPRLDGLLALPGVIETAEGDVSEARRSAREAALQADLAGAFVALTATRQEEGERLEALILDHIERIAAGVDAAAQTDAARPEAIRERLRAQVAELLEAGSGLPEERVAQEAAMIATKADVREELDRLRSHVSAVRELIAAGGAIGRRLDFLCQEFNREANTLCAKSWDVTLSRIGLDLKATIDQLREQVQNLE